MHCRYNMKMHTDGLTCEPTLHPHRSGETQLQLSPLLLESGGYGDHIAPVVSCGKKVCQVHKSVSSQSQPVFRLAHGLRASQVAEPPARSNIWRRIGYGRATGPHIDREVHA